MYPYDLIEGTGIDLYVVFLCLGIFAALLVFRLLADRAGLSARLHNLCIYTAIGAIAFGYFSAVLFQAFYNIAKLGRFVINAQTGATFYGGLIGGAASFLGIYFGVGHIRFRETREHISRFLTVTDIAACSIAVAHALGRIGCLMAGCCHGKVTDAWYGIRMAYSGQRVVPTQLFEAIYLLLLFALLVWCFRRAKGYNLPIYMIAYGIWRFVLEYMRDDERGKTFISFLTPSQLTAVLMILGGAAIIAVIATLRKRGRKEHEA